MHIGTQAQSLSSSIDGETELFESSSQLNQPILKMIQ